VQIGFAFKHQLDDDLDGPEQQAVDQTVKNAAEQAEKKPPAIRPDEAPELAQEINHYVLIYAGDATAGENFLSSRAAHWGVAGLTTPVAVSKTGRMNLRQFVKYWLWRDTTHRGEFTALRRLMTPDFPRVVVDVGANDGFYGSNSFPFVARGWRAILIEPHPEAFAQLQKLHQGRTNVTGLNLACAGERGTLPLFLGKDPSTSTLSDDPELLKTRTRDTILVSVERLSDVLAAQKISPDIGLLSVDAEGMDLEVLQGLDFSYWRPRIIITEDYLPKFASKSALLTGSDYRLQLQIAGNSIWSSTRLGKPA
jgi:FkbM family methyltransferase